MHWWSQSEITTASESECNSSTHETTPDLEGNSSELNWMDAFGVRADDGLTSNSDDVWNAIGAFQNPELFGDASPFSSSAYDSDTSLSQSTTSGMGTLPSHTHAAYRPALPASSHLAPVASHPGASATMVPTQHAHVKQDPYPATRPTLDAVPARTTAMQQQHNSSSRAPRARPSTRSSYTNSVDFDRAYDVLMNPSGYGPRPRHLTSAQITDYCKLHFVEIQRRSRGRGSDKWKIGGSSITGESTNGCKVSRRYGTLELLGSSLHGKTTKFHAYQLETNDKNAVMGTYYHAKPRGAEITLHDTGGQPRPPPPPGPPTPALPRSALPALAPALKIEDTYTKEERPIQRQVHAYGAASQKRRRSAAPRAPGGGRGRHPAPDPGPAPVQSTMPCGGQLSVVGSKSNHMVAGKLSVQMSNDEDNTFVNFLLPSGESVGRIHYGGEGHTGITIEGQSGDFAEWHKRKHGTPAFDEGDVVGFVDDDGGELALTRDLKHARMVGIISRRALMKGSMPAATERDQCDTVAYIGQVPVKARSGYDYRNGDVMIPDGADDGVAIALRARRCNWLVEVFMHAPASLGVVVQASTIDHPAATPVDEEDTEALFTTESESPQKSMEIPLREIGERPTNKQPMFCMVPCNVFSPIDSLHKTHSRPKHGTLVLTLLTTAVLLYQAWLYQYRGKGGPFVTSQPACDGSDCGFPEVGPGANAIANANAEPRLVLRDRVGTFGGTGQGNDCVFPFLYKGIEHRQCTDTANKGVPWCATAYDYDSLHLWGDCIKHDVPWDPHSGCNCLPTLPNELRRIGFSTGCDAPLNYSRNTLELFGIRGKVPPDYRWCLADTSLCSDAAAHPVFSAAPHTVLFSKYGRVGMSQAACGTRDTCYDRGIYGETCLLLEPYCRSAVERDSDGSLQRWVQRNCPVTCGLCTRPIGSPRRTCSDFTSTRVKVGGAHPHPELTCAQLVQKVVHGAGALQPPLTLPEVGGVSQLRLDVHDVENSTVASMVRIACARTCGACSDLDQTDVRSAITRNGSWRYPESVVGVATHPWARIVQIMQGMRWRLVDVQIVQPSAQRLYPGDFECNEFTVQGFRTDARQGNGWMNDLYTLGPWVVANMPVYWGSSGSFCIMYCDGSWILSSLSNVAVNAENFCNAEGYLVTASSMANQTWRQLWVGPESSSWAQRSIQATCTGRQVEDYELGSNEVNTVGEVNRVRPSTYGVACTLETCDVGTTVMLAADDRLGCIDSAESGFQAPYKTCASMGSRSGSNPHKYIDGVPEICTDPKFRAVLRKNCPRTCGVCGPGGMRGGSAELSSDWCPGCLLPGRVGIIYSVHRDRTAPEFLVAPLAMFAGTVSAHSTLRWFTMGNLIGPRTPLPAGRVAQNKCRCMRDTQQLDPFLADVFPNFGRSCTTKAFPQGGAYRTRAWCYVAEGVCADQQLVSCAAGSSIDPQAPFRDNMNRRVPGACLRDATADQGPDSSADYVRIGWLSTLPCVGWEEHAHASIDGTSDVSLGNHQPLQYSLEECYLECARRVPCLSFLYWETQRYCELWSKTGPRSPQVDAGGISVYVKPLAGVKALNDWSLFSANMTCGKHTATAYVAQLELATLRGRTNLPKEGLPDTSELNHLFGSAVQYKKALGGGRDMQLGVCQAAAMLDADCGSVVFSDAGVRAHEGGACSCVRRGYSCKVVAAPPFDANAIIPRPQRGSVYTLGAGRHAAPRCPAYSVNECTRVPCTCSAHQIKVFGRVHGVVCFSCKDPSRDSVIDATPSIVVRASDAMASDCASARRQALCRVARQVCGTTCPPLGQDITYLGCVCEQRWSPSSVSHCAAASNKAGQPTTVAGCGMHTPCDGDDTSRAIHGGASTWCKIDRTRPCQWRETEFNGTHSFYQAPETDGCTPNASAGYTNEWHLDSGSGSEGEGSGYGDTMWPVLDQDEVLLSY